MIILSHRYDGFEPQVFGVLTYSFRKAGHSTMLEQGE